VGVMRPSVFRSAGNDALVPLPPADADGTRDALSFVRATLTNSIIKTSASSHFDFRVDAGQF
jgi:hypothetical protein